MQNQIRINELKKRNEELSPLIFKPFDTAEELKNYTFEHKVIFEEYYNNRAEIEQLD
jgi:hypothetical protein